MLFSVDMRIFKCLSIHVRVNISEAIYVRVKDI